MKKENKILRVILNIVIWLVIIAAIFISLITITSNGDGIPNINGIAPLSVQSGSMEPTIKKGDFILTTLIDDNTELSEKDIISFYSYEQGIQIIKTHRINKVEVVDGISYYTTKGDNNDEVDSEVITREDIISTYNNTRVPILGYVVNILKSKWGFLCLIIIPLSLLFIFQIIDFMKTLLEMKLEDN